jgi:RecG-like helicase
MKRKSNTMPMWRAMEETKVGEARGRSKMIEGTMETEAAEGAEAIVVIEAIEEVEVAEEAEAEATERTEATGETEVAGVAGISSQEMNTSSQRTLLRTQTSMFGTKMTRSSTVGFSSPSP